VRDLAATGNGDEATFAAADQTIHTATWSHEAALVAWSEVRDGRRTVHAGVRTADGGWRENRIGTNGDVVLASSDGASFLVVKQENDGWSALTLSDTAEILASTAKIRTFTPTGITWDGTGWVVIGVSSNNTQIFVARVMPWGAVSSPVLIEQRTGTRMLENPRIVSGGGGFLAVWQNSNFEMCFPVCDPYESVLHGTRLTMGLQRVHPLTIEIAPDEAVAPDVYWNGERFQIFWLDGGALETRSLRPDEGGSGTTRIAGALIETGRLRATLTPFGTAITSNDGEVLLIRNGDLIQRYTLGNPNSPDALVNLGANVAYVQAQSRDEMPYHGASHVFLTTGGVIPRDTLPLPPRDVRASMTDGGKLMVLQWTAPPDAINGYRVEYRVDDGTWNEFDEWFDAGTTWVSIEPWLENVKYQFRVRAWSDSGVSAYSTPATVRQLGRRRSMR
jgi:Fibronectin type III domain